MILPRALKHGMQQISQCFDINRTSHRLSLPTTSDHRGGCGVQRKALYLLASVLSPCFAGCCQGLLDILNSCQHDPPTPNPKP